MKEDDRLIMSRRALAHEQGGARGAGGWFARLPNLVRAPADDIQASLQGLGDLLATSGATATIGFHLRSGDAIEHWTLHIRPSGAETRKKAAERTDLEVIMDSEAWIEIASGRVSPLDAFAAGRMRIRGNVNAPAVREVARRLGLDDPHAGPKE